MSSPFIRSGSRTPSPRRSYSSRDALTVPRSEQRVKSPEVEVIHELWQKTKESLQSKAMALSRIERLKSEMTLNKERELEMAVKSLENECLDLRDQVRYSELQLKNSNDSNKKLQNQMDAVEEEAERLEERLRVQKDLNRTQAAQIAELNQKLKDSQVKYEERLKEASARFEDEVDRLRDELRSYRSQADDSSERVISLKHKLSQESKAIEKKDDEVRKLRLSLEESESAAASLRARLADAETLHKEMRLQADDRDQIISSLRKRVAEFEDETSVLQRSCTDQGDLVSSLRQRISEQEGSIAFLTELQDKQRRQNVMLDERVQERDNELQQALKRVKELELQVEMVAVSRRSEGPLLIECEQLKRDNQRLLSMLASTKEYREFVLSAQDAGGFMRFMPAGVTPATILETAMMLDPDTEEENWVPGEALRVAQDLQIKFSQGLGADVIADLLKQLNRVWRSRESKKIERVKQRYQFEIESLRRQVANKVPFEEVHARQEINRLRTELRQAQKQAKVASVLKENQKRFPPSLQYMDSALKLASTLQSQRHGLEAENASLKERIQELIEYINSGERETVSYQEGCRWMSKESLAVVERTGRHIDEIVREYNIRTVNLHYGEEDYALKVVKLQTWLVESIEKEVVLLRTELNTLLTTQMDRPIPPKRFSSLADVLDGPRSDHQSPSLLSDYSTPRPRSASVPRSRGFN